MPDYRVQTDIYNGPMDLLLYLIRREEVDIYDIPIARVTQQYLSYVTTLKSIDPNIAGEFLVLAATLMEIKSRMLLPRPPAETGEEEDLSDPRLELVRQLLEYKKYKDASLDLADAAREAAMRWPRLPAKLEKESPGVVDLDEVQIWDLVAVFNKLMAAIGARSTTHDVVFDDTPIALHAADILDRLQSENGEMSFEGIFAGRTKVEMIGLFLALLELMRQRRVKVTQAGHFGIIRITLLSAEPIEIGDEWMPAIQEAVLGTVTDETVNDFSQSVPPRASLDADDEDEESFAELDQIKTDVDIDAILHDTAISPEEKAE
ncbi:MAG: segregation/condensation protein A [Planctomycetota bacterium]